MARQYHQGIYTPQNPHKYIGDVNNIVFRSGWEKKCMIFFDTNPSFINWGSEEIVIPYISPKDGRPHRYFTDFAVKYKTRTGEVRKALVEVKPYKQTQPPKQPKRMTKTFYESLETYAVNQAKWKYAKEWCDKKGWDFIILTEEQILGKKV